MSPWERCPPLVLLSKERDLAYLTVKGALRNYLVQNVCGILYVVWIVVIFLLSKTGF